MVEVRSEGGLPVCASKRVFGKNAALSGKSDPAVRPQPPSKEPLIQCPYCGSTKTWQAGTRETKQGPVQRRECRTCGYRFSEKGPRGSARPLQEISDWHLKAKRDISRDCQVCDEPSGRVHLALARGADSLATVETRREEAPREGTLKGALSQQKIVDYILYLQKTGLAEITVLSKVKLIKRLAKLGADLYDPESVKEVIAKQKWSLGRKGLACEAYTPFLAMMGGTWEHPKYKVVEKEPFIPQPVEAKQLIAGCSPRMACFLQGLSETAMRPGEFWQMSWKDYDEPSRTIRVTPEKGSKSGTYKISKELAAMLDSLPREYGDRIFSRPGMDLDDHAGNFRKQRKRIAHKLKNPRLLYITFKTFRHLKGTLEAWRTNNPFAVQQLLRHRNINNTMRYIHLAQLLFKNEKEYYSETAGNTDEARRLLERGWTYVTGEYDDGGKIFVKPKDPLAEQ